MAEQDKPHLIVRIPCPHCSTLCSPQTEYCRKCGEPIPQTLKGESQGIPKEKGSESLDAILNAVGIIKALEREIDKPIPKQDAIKPNANGYKERDGEIVGLSIYNCHLKKIPTSILTMISLKALFLRRNMLAELPAQIGNLLNLEILDVRINNLGSLPKSISLLSKLRHFNISSNALYELPDAMGTMKCLEKLNLANNKLRTIPPSIFTLESLNKLNIKVNYWIQLPNEFKNTHAAIIT